jgi:hypothetical protein
LRNSEAARVAVEVELIGVTVSLLVVEVVAISGVLNTVAGNRCATCLEGSLPCQASLVAQLIVCQAGELR